MSNTEPVVLSAHRSLILAEGVDGLRYEVTHDPAAHEEVADDLSERHVTLTFKPEEARRVATYMTAIGWRRVRVVAVSLADLRNGERSLLVDTPEKLTRTVRFAAAGSIACIAVTDGQPHQE